MTAPVRARSTATPRTAFRGVMTRERWFGVARIAAVSTLILFYYLAVIPLPLLLVAVAIGLYPLAKKGLVDLVRERKIGTEIFVTLATIIAMIGGEYVAGAVLLVIVLIAELIAEVNADRARASIKALIGSVPQTALVRRFDRDETIAIADLRAGDVVIVRAGEKIPVDGVVRAGEASVDQSPITGESMPQEKNAGSLVFAGTVVDLVIIAAIAQATRRSCASTASKRRRSPQIAARYSWPRAGRMRARSCSLTSLGRAPKQASRFSGRTASSAW